MTIARRNPLADARSLYPTWSHPDVLRNANTWRMLRDCMDGEEAIKERGEEYLPKLEKMEQGDYDAYKGRAVFYPMMAKTVEVMTGKAFTRKPKITGVPGKLLKRLLRATANDTAVDIFLKHAVQEVILMGRYGILVDMDRDGKGSAYFVGFPTESIIDWDVRTLDGKEVLFGVVLRTIEYRHSGFGHDREMGVVYRVLELVPDPDRAGRLMYRQRIYDAGDGQDFDIRTAAYEYVVPRRNGIPLTRIPFFMPGAMTPTPSVDKSPVKDIASLNLSHYRSYADLEHGRFYCALPVFYVTHPPMASGKEPEYAIGPSMVWHLSTQEKAGIVEFNGQGLQPLERAIAQKEDHIATLGGRLLSGRSRNVAESDNSLKMQESSEQTILHNVVLSMNDAMTIAIRTWLWWMGEEDVDDAEIEISTEFLMDTFGARELRAIHDMYKDGLITIDAMHAYLQRAKVLPDWLDLQEYIAALSDPAQFPNMPDILARMRGYPDKKSWLEHKRALRELRLDERSVDLDEQGLAAQLERDKRKPPTPAPVPSPRPEDV